MRALVSMVVAGILVGAPATAPAQEGVVAVLPLAAAEPRMEMYGPPVAQALAARLGKVTGVRVELLAGTAPERVDLVVDGSILTRPDGMVMLEARVRDPARGLVVASASTDHAPLPRIDELAAALGEKLARALPRALAAARRRGGAGAQATVVEVPEAVVEGRQEWFARAGEARLGAPPLLVYRASGQAAYGNVAVEQPASRAAYELVAGLGFQPLVADGRGLVAPDRVVDELGRAGARFALMVDVRDIEFHWDEVLLARGRVRILLVGADGRVRLDRTVATDTLVGSRGDRHAALIHFVARQAGQIVAPDLRAALVAAERP